MSNKIVAIESDQPNIEPINNLGRKTMYFPADFIPSRLEMAIKLSKDSGQPTVNELHNAFNTTGLNHNGAHEYAVAIGKSILELRNSSDRTPDRLVLDGNGHPNPKIFGNNEIAHFQCVKGFLGHAMDTMTQYYNGDKTGEEQKTKMQTLYLTSVSMGLEEEVKVLGEAFAQAAAIETR